MAREFWLEKLIVPLVLIVPRLVVIIITPFEAREP